MERSKGLLSTLSDLSDLKQATSTSTSVGFNDRKDHLAVEAIIHDPNLAASPEEYKWLFLKSHRQDACATNTGSADVPGLQSGAALQSGTGFQPVRIEFEVFTPHGEWEVPATPAGMPVPLRMA
ncbi:MAG: hypothetical protein WA005_12115 [Candidatus Binataceae bacterium]